MIGTEPSTSGAILRKLVATTATDNFTMSMWFRNRPGATTNCLAYNGNQTGSGFGFQMQPGGLIALYGGVVVGATIPVTEMEWHHAVLFRRAGTSQMIVDGHRFSATWANAPIAPNGGVDELRMFETNGPYANGIGATSEVGVWTVPLTLDQCMALANGAKPNQIGPRPVFYWTGEGVLDRITGVAMTGNSYRMLRGPDLRTISLPFAVEIPPSEPENQDAATVYIDIQVSAAQEFAAADSATVPIRITPSATFQYTDATTVYVNISFLGGECYSTFSGLMMDGEADTRWYGLEQATWFVSDVNTRWETGDIQVEGVNC